MRFMISTLMIFAAVTTYAEVGFKRGNNLTLRNATGYASVMCYDQKNYGHVGAYCDAVLVSPGTFDRIVNTGAPIDADRVQLTATREDGSTRTKKEKFNSNTQESGSFNLVVSTLTQKPLLKSGKNSIQYQFAGSGKQVAQGEFEVLVEQRPEASCETLHFSMYARCDQHFSICDEYFNRQPRCN